MLIWCTPPLSSCISPRFWQLLKTLISLRWDPLRRPSAPLQFKDPSDEGRLTDELAFHVGKSDQVFCPYTPRLLHTGVKRGMAPGYSCGAHWQFPLKFDDFWKSHFWDKKRRPDTMAEPFAILELFGIP